MLIDKLYDLGALKFGSFTLKSGTISPFYLDLRLSVSFPELLIAIADAIENAVRERSFDLICGVPYTALPFATALSIRHQRPMVLTRKEKKEHGTGKMCEGVFSQGQKCLIIEDVITSGQSILNTIAVLEAEGLNVQDIAVVVDREQGGRELLEKKGYRLHSLYTIRQIAEYLSNEGKIDAAALTTIHEFIRR
jgi:uridine monophosphate synthetase